MIRFYQVHGFFFYQVHILEAGSKDRSWKFHMPAALMYTLKDPKYNWCYYTTPQKHLNNRNCYWPRARVWGGCSNHNAMVYIRGNALDYDNWERLGAAGWSYADCLPYFRKSEKYELGDDEYRGATGPTGISRGKQENNPLFKAFVDAGIEAGYPYTKDVNGYQQEGFGSFDFTIWKGKRSSASTDYLRPAESRSNLKISSKVLATKILFEGKRAVGVEYEQNKQTVRTRARKEVIVSAGAINTPQLLLSGVGPADHLKAMDIPVHHHLPGVGQNLQVRHLVCIRIDGCVRHPMSVRMCRYLYMYNVMYCSMSSGVDQNLQVLTCTSWMCNLRSCYV